MALVQSSTEGHSEGGVVRAEAVAAELAVNRSRQEGKGPLLLPNHTLEVETIRVDVSVNLQSTQATCSYCTYIHAAQMTCIQLCHIG